jgi:hypothetical protein
MTNRTKKFSSIRLFGSIFMSFDDNLELNELNRNRNGFLLTSRMTRVYPVENRITEYLHITCVLYYINNLQSVKRAKMRIIRIGSKNSVPSVPNRLSTGY